MRLAIGRLSIVCAKTSMTFTGDVSIRTKPRSELVSGSSREQTMKAPLRLDVQDAVVVVMQNR